MLFANFISVCLLVGNDGDESDSEKGNHRVSRKPLMRTLTNADNKLTNRAFEQDSLAQSMSHWRHSKANVNRLRSLDSFEAGQAEAAAHTNAAPSSHRFRAHKAFDKFVQQSMDFARRR